MITADIADTTASEQAQKDPVTVLSNGWYYIRSKHSGKYLDVENYGRDGERNVYQWSYTGDTNQKWYLLLSKDYDGYYRIGVNVNGDPYYLEIKDAQISNEANCQIGSYSKSEEQYFFISGSNNSSYFTIKNFASDKYLDVSNYSKVDGGNVYQWSETGNRNQIWEFFPVVSQ